MIRLPCALGSQFRGRVALVTGARYPSSIKNSLARARVPQVHRPHYLSVNSLAGLPEASRSLPETSGRLVPGPDGTLGPPYSDQRRPLFLKNAPPIIKGALGSHRAPWASWAPWGPMGPHGGPMGPHGAPRGPHGAPGSLPSAAVEPELQAETSQKTEPSRKTPPGNPDPGFLWPRGSLGHF